MSLLGRLDLERVRRRARVWSSRAVPPLRRSYGRVRAGAERVRPHALRLRSVLVRSCGRLRAEVAIGLAALVVSGASLITIVRHAVIMEKMLAADTYPFLEFDHSNYDDERQREAVSFELRNAGVGPAKLEALQMSYEGEALDSSKGLLLKCCGVDVQKLKTREEFIAAIGFLVEDSPPPAMITAGETRTLLQLEKASANPSFYATLNQARRKVTLKACYCSVFDDCWVAEFRSLAPLSVRDCSRPARGDWPESENRER